MIWIILGAWLLCATVGYLLARHFTHTNTGGWTVGDRNKGLFISVTCGPVLVVVMLVFFVFQDADLDKPSSW